jgi:hypothetical protein
LDIQWFQLYSVTNGSMRLSFAFLNASGTQLASTDFNTSIGHSSGWAGTVAASSFERQFHRLIVPAGAKQLRANFASGGASSVTGVFVIDDLSIQLTRPVITDVTLDSSGLNLTWNSAPGKTYTVLFESALGGTNTWTALTTGLPPSSPDGLTATYTDTTAQPGGQGFYWVKQE